MAPGNDESLFRRPARSILLMRPQSGRYRRGLTGSGPGGKAALPSLLSDVAAAAAMVKALVQAASVDIEVIPNPARVVLRISMSKNQTDR